MEETFTGRALPLIWSTDAEGADHEFIGCGEDILESEQLSNRLYELYLSLITENWVYAREEKDWGYSLGAAYYHGFYYPCVERVILSGQVDTLNDGLPDYSGVAMTFKDSDRPMFISARRAPVPRGEAAVIRGLSYRVSTFIAAEGQTTFRLTRSDKRATKAGVLEMRTASVIIRPGDGKIAVCGPSGGFDKFGDHRHVRGFSALWAHNASCAINLWEDASCLWQVDTTEPIMEGASTPLRLGVTAEHVKSLFYARQTPLTETGRKRPILHWVRAHQRRMRSGIDIDINKHLRGITSFEMDGFSFQITRPLKVPKLRGMSEC